MLITVKMNIKGIFIEFQFDNIMYNYLFESKWISGDLIVNYELKMTTCYFVAQV